jgi:hypothetical protein
MSTATMPRRAWRRSGWPMPTAAFPQGLPDRSRRLPALGVITRATTDVHAAAPLRRDHRAPDSPRPATPSG